MASEIGFDAQTPSLPRGGGALGGLGETFTPDLSTGTGTFEIPIDLPNGPGDIGPRLRLRYDTGSPNGVFGMGWSLPLPRLARSVAHGFPRFDDGDALVLEGAGELLVAPDGTLRPVVDAGLWRARRQGDGFVVTDRGGLEYAMGLSAAGRLTDPDEPGRAFAWHVERIEDALGNAVTFSWQRHGSQLYLDRLAYGVYEVVFGYAPRPDRLRWGRAGFLIETARRATSIELRLPSSPQPVLRRLSLHYRQLPRSGVSMLSEVVLTGHDADGGTVSAPPLRLDYTTAKSRQLNRLAKPPGLAGPPTLDGTGGRVELVDWNADGLPDVLEIAPGGRNRLWPNAGDLTWSVPQTLPPLPAIGSAGRQVVLADMNGDGTADLVVSDRRLRGYLPRSPDGTLGREVAWSRAPVLSGGGVQFLDLDGDGALDVMTSSQVGLTLHVREQEQWTGLPRVIPRGQAPPVDLADPHVRVADMTGDGTADLVRIDASGVTYWPFLGDGRWGSAVSMSDPPAFRWDVRADEFVLADLDGDGCADVVHVSHGNVRWWINQSGNGFAPPVEVPGLPTGQMLPIRVVDMTGAGTAGVLWSAIGAGGRGAHYFYLDTHGSSKPGLLERIDNGLGLVTTVSYTTSAREAARDRSEGRPWSASLPISVPVVNETVETDTTTGAATIHRLRYRNGRFDGVLREFAGFAEVTDDLIGDATAPTLRTISEFDVGLRDDGTEPATLAERHRRRAIRGRVLRQERFGLDGSADERRPYDRLQQTWEIDEIPLPGGATSFRPRLVESRRETLERTAGVAASLVTTNLAWDADGNVLDSEQRAEAPSNPALNEVLRTTTAYAADPTGRFRGRVWRVQQFDGDGAQVADTITEYDGAAAGSIGAEGLVTRRQSMVLTDQLVDDVYGVAPPDFAGLGYVRGPDDDSWWAVQGRWERIDDATGLRGRAIAVDGSAITFDFDANRTYPERITDPRGNAVVAEHDYRVFRIRRLTDATGQATEATYDPLSRITALVEPGDTLAQPTAIFDYVTASLPAAGSVRRRPVSGQNSTIDERRHYDGAGRLLETRVVDVGGEVITESFQYGTRGLLARRHLPRRAASADYEAPPAGAPATTFAYDALGRLVREENPDDGIRTVAFGALTETIGDPEDNRAGGPHAGTPTIHRLDPAGRVREIVQSLGGRLVVSTYRYDVKGNLIEHVDAMGNRVRISYDLLGRPIRTERPEQVTRTVFDARGNAIAALGPAGTLVSREFDECRRPVTVRMGGVAAPAMRFTYHDNGAPAPPDAGDRTAGGRLVRIDDDAGVTILDYDPRGRATSKRVRPTGSATTYQIDLELRSDDSIASIVYPDAGAGRRRVTYEYDRRGLLARAPSIVSTAEHDLAGRRTRVRYQNGVEHHVDYQPLSGRPSRIEVIGPAGSIVSMSPTYDGVGNLLRNASPDPDRAATYVFDDLYRLVDATTDAGDAWSYRYDDAANLTFKSDVGDFRYGEGGAPATCLTSAGPANYSYTPLGEMSTTPWGTQSWNEMGRLRAIDGLPGGGSMAFRYDFAGHRAAAVGVAGGVARNRLTPDPFFSVENGDLILHLFDGEGIVAVQRATTGTTAFLHPDQLGGVAAVTDAAGAVVEEIRYDPYGAVRSRIGGPADPSVVASFTGADLDPWSGLLYLEARYYNPAIGRFVSPDSVVANVYDPVAWSSYVYCAGNPVSFVDWSGHAWWEIVIAAVAIIAVVVLTIATFGVGAALLAVAIGIVAGGVVGGLAAAQKGGGLEEIITGALVGAAVGGWAAFGSLYAGAAVAGAIGQGGTLFGAIVAGGVNGTINGAAMGFAAGYAGGLGTLDDVWTKTWQGALVGLVAGAIIGGVAHSISPPSKSLPDTVRDAYRVPEQAPAPTPQAPGGASQPPWAAPPPPTTELGAAQQVGTGLLGKGASAAGGWAARVALTTPAMRVAVQVLVVDAAAGAWDLGYVPWILEKIGVVKTSGSI